MDDHWMGLTPEEAAAEADGEAALAAEAGTCCTDPTPEVEALTDEPGEVGLQPHYCSACGGDLTPEAYEALRADPEGVRERIRAARAARRVG